MVLAVEPDQFTLAPSGSQTISITADVSGLPLDDWAFAEVSLEPSDGNLPDAHFPVAVYVTEGPPEDSPKLFLPVVLNSHLQEAPTAGPNEGGAHFALTSLGLVPAVMFGLGYMSWKRIPSSTRGR